MDSKLTERVKLTQSKLRRRTLSAIFQEFDQKIMKLERGKREEKYLKMSETPFSFFAAALICFILTHHEFGFLITRQRGVPLGLRAICTLRTLVLSAMSKVRSSMM